jgi:hypothetical protein
MKHIFKFSLVIIFTMQSASCLYAMEDRPASNIKRHNSNVTLATLAAAATTTCAVQPAEQNKIQSCASTARCGGAGCLLNDPSLVYGVVDTSAGKNANPASCLEDYCP